MQPVGAQLNPWIPISIRQAAYLRTLMRQAGAQLNPRYVPQLQQVLAMPQSIGIVGGRPGSSLYFLGCQDSHVIYLDPHQVQQVRQGPCLSCSRVVGARSQGAQRSGAIELLMWWLPRTS